MPSAAAEFACPEVVIGLSILAYRYEGLRDSDIKTLMRRMKEEMMADSGVDDSSADAVPGPGGEDNEGNTATDNSAVTSGIEAAAPAPDADPAAAAPAAAVPDASGGGGGEEKSLEAMKRELKEALAKLQQQEEQKDSQKEGDGGGEKQQS